MVKWEYCSLRWETEGMLNDQSRFYIDVDHDIRQKVVEHLNAAIPELKARVNKKNRIEVDMVYTLNTLMNALGEAGWELAGIGGYQGGDYVFKRPREA